MRKLILLAAVVLLTACSNDSKQINFAKEFLKKRGSSPSEIESTQFKVTEAISSDIYSVLYDKKTEMIKESIYAGVDTKDLEKKADEFLKKSKSDSGHCFKVQCYRLVDKDTVSNSVIYLDDKNNLIDFEYLK